MPGPAATPSASAPATPPVVPDKKVVPIDMAAARKDPVLGKLITDIAVVAWTPEPGWAVTEIRESGEFMTFLSGDGIRGGGQPLLNETGSLRSLFPAAGIDDPAVVTADPLTRSELGIAADLLSAVPGVGKTRVVTVRGMWFRAGITGEDVPGREDDMLRSVIGQPGIQGGSVHPGPGSEVGKVRYTAEVTYVGGGVDRDGFEQIRTGLATCLGAEAGDVAVRRLDAEPE